MNLKYNKLLLKINNKWMIRKINGFKLKVLKEENIKSWKKWNKIKNLY